MFQLRRDHRQLLKQSQWSGEAETGFGFELVRRKRQIGGRDSKTCFQEFWC